MFSFTNKTAQYITECKRLNINVLPPSVNESNHDFTVSGKNIRYGLLAVKNLGRQFIDRIIAERSSGIYTSFFDFCKRLYGKYMNSRAIESLIKCGAFDTLGANRRQMLMGMNEIIDELDSKKRRNVEGQIGLFDSIVKGNGLLRFFEIIIFYR